MSKKINPGPAGTGRGAKGSTSTAKPFTEATAPTPAQFVAPQPRREFLLHVDPMTGIEERLPCGGYPRQLRTLHVIIDGEWETTKTANVKQYCGAVCDIISVRPRGADWEVLDDTQDNWTSWRRAAVRS
jgi:hypothetical protein